MKFFKQFSIRSRLLITFSTMLVFMFIITAYSIFVIQSLGGFSNSVIVLIALMSFSFLYGLFVMISFINSIVKPIKFLTDVAVDVGNGDLNILLHTDEKDEIGIFKNSFGKMINIINDLTEEIEFVVVAQSEGVSDILIDSNKYYGKFNEIAKLVNDMITEQNEITNSAINTVFEIASGNFSATSKKFPGDKAILNQTIEVLRDNLSSVHSEISSLAHNAIIGKLEDRANVSRFSGDWSGLMSEINSLLKAFTAPINETLVVLEKIAHGDFSTQMEGSYQGTYQKIKESVNFMISEIGGYIDEITCVLEATSDKDFTVSIQREYVGDFNFLKKSINKILNDLNATFVNIHSVSEQLNIGSKVVSSSSMTLASGFQEQTDTMNSLLEVLLDFERISLKNSAESEDATNISNLANNGARLGVEEMRKLLAAMSEIQKSSDNISKIIKITEDIAFQINLLSINASIEASHAGSHGVGFAVVAQEVRELAGKSRNIAEEVTSSITSSTEKVAAGAKIVKTATDMLNSISSQISSISKIISDISTVSKEQVKKINIVHSDTQKISSLTNKNFDTPHQFAATAQELSSQAEVLNNVLGGFKLKIAAEY